MNRFFQTLFFYPHKKGPREAKDLAAGRWASATRRKHNDLRKVPINGSNKKMGNEMQEKTNVCTCTVTQDENRLFLKRILCGSRIRRVLKNYEKEGKKEKKVSNTLNYTRRFILCPICATIGKCV